MDKARSILQVITLSTLSGLIGQQQGEHNLTCAGRKHAWCKVRAQVTGNANSAQSLHRCVLRSFSVLAGRGGCGRWVRLDNDHDDTNMIPPHASCMDGGGGERTLAVSLLTCADIKPHRYHLGQPAVQSVMKEVVTADVLKLDKCVDLKQSKKSP